MIDWLRLAESLITSPWLYAVLIAVSFLDSFLPLIPSEPVVIVAGVYAATGITDIVLVIAATTLGAFLGDLVPYIVGRLLGSRLLERMPPGSRRRAAHDWFTRELDARGAFVLVTTRFIPVGRYLATLSTGIVGYPLSKYMLFVAVAIPAAVRGLRGLPLGGSCSGAGSPRAGDVRRSEEPKAEPLMSSRANTTDERAEVAGADPRFGGGGRAPGRPVAFVR
jgi:membrane-associated protein